MMDLEPDIVPQADAVRHIQQRRVVDQAPARQNFKTVQAEKIAKPGTKMFTFEESNLNDTVHTILQCLSNVSAKRYYGISVLTDILRGANSQKIKSAELDSIPEYGALKLHSP